SYLNDEGKSYDNRWMHRPIIDWEKNKKISDPHSIESIIFNATKKLISIRKQHFLVGDHKNLTWLTPHNHQIAGYLRTYDDKKLYCLFNFSNQSAYLTWYAFKEHGGFKPKLYDYWKEKEYTIGLDNDYLIIEPYGFHLLEPRE
ncbi:MAG: alpha-glucosidase C-terminal domain-containing protein, partial [Chitinophagaceae bacterium]